MKIEEIDFEKIEREIKRKNIIDSIINISESILLGICFIAIGALGMFAYYNLDFHNEPTLSSLDSCKSDSLETSALCLQNELGTFYNYNLTNRKKDLTETELKEIGGVCWHYARWYQNKMSGLGFYAKTVSFDLDNESSHMIAIASTVDTYCILDQSNVGCFKVGNSKEDNETKLMEVILE